jgi:flagellar motility protein MotE (MotC chaperone)
MNHKHVCSDDLEKFIPRVKRMIAALHAYQRDLQAGHPVDELYYKQKLEALTQLEDSIDETLERLKFLEDKFESEYAQVYNQLRKDVRRMNKIINTSYVKQPSILRDP